ncbi:MAG: HRDC domain-containing protein [Anaerolineales bacterium]|nr:HRDC domain-containing protein [Anaerolineales bacterium]
MTRNWQRILGWQQVGLAAILEHQFEIVSDKRMQRTNWGKRPLMPQQIAYAQMDTHYLLALRSLLMEQLQARGRWEEAQDAFAHLVSTDYTQRIPEERSFWHMKSIRAVPRERMAILAALWQWREEEARRQNRPPFKVINDAVLVELAQTTPKETKQLSTIHGLSDLQIDRYGRVLLQTVSDNLNRPAPQPPEFDQRPDAELEKPAILRFDILRKWRSEKAHQRNVAPDIVLTNSTLLAIAQRNPATVAELSLVADLGPWKLKTYGPEILDAILPYR